MADEEKKHLEEARRRPLAERVVNKLWKARVEAFEDMLSACEKVFNDEDPLLEEYGIILLFLKLKSPIIISYYSSFNNNN